MLLNIDLAAQIRLNVQAAFDEDFGTLTRNLDGWTGSRGAALANYDLTAQLIPEHASAHASVMTRQDMVLCGTQWFDECFRELDVHCGIHWNLREGERAEAGQTLCEIKGSARAMLGAERPALNFLQTLCATATITRRYVDAVSGTHAKIMDTRKTLPGLRIAQKYAVAVGGGHNQRVGLYDGILIKENHILAAGGIRPVLERAFRIAPPNTSVQIEVEKLEQLREALDAGAKLVLLDNFSQAQMGEAVKLNAGRAELEASGGITLDTVRAIAETGVDRISIGSLTKDVQAVDLSMRFTPI